MVYTTTTLTMTAARQQLKHHTPRSPTEENLIRVHLDDSKYEERPGRPTTHKRTNKSLWKSAQSAEAAPLRPKVPSSSWEE